MHLFIELLELFQLIISDSSKGGPTASHFMDPTCDILSQPVHHDFSVDFEPILLAPAGLCAFSPVIFRKIICHPGLFGNFLTDVTVIVVDHLAVHQTHGCELVDAGEIDRFGEGRVDVSEGMPLWKSHR